MPLIMMHMRSVTFLLFLFFPLLAFAQFVPKSQDEDDLFYTFYNYQAYVDGAMGEKLASKLDTATLAFYTQVLNNVKNAEEAELLEADITTWYLVMLTRFMAPDGTIAAMTDEKGLLTFLAKNLFQREMAGLEVYNIIAADGEAEVYVMKDGQTLDLVYHFVQYADADWRLSLTKQIIQSEREIQTALRDEKVMKAYNHEKKLLLNNIIQSKGWDQGGRDLWKVRQ
jgi:hypothetical protein